MHSLDTWAGAYMSGFTVEVSSQCIPRGHAQLDLLKLLHEGLVCMSFYPGSATSNSYGGRSGCSGRTGAQAHNRKNEHTADFHFPQGSKLHL